MLCACAAHAQDLLSLQPQDAVPAAREHGVWHADIAVAPDHSSHAMVWRSLGRLSLGLGMQHVPTTSLGMLPERDSSELLVGVGVRTGRQARLSLQSWTVPVSGAETARAPQPGAQPGAMALKSSDPWRAIRRGMLRMDLDSSSSIGLRLRAKKVVLQYNKRW